MLGFKQLKTGYAGFTLVEVLVSTLVLMVGILGVAAMQLVSFQNNQGAYLRSQAIYVASDYIARMRANPNGYNNTTVYDAVDTNSADDLPSASACTTSALGCTAAQMAAQDVREFWANFSNVNNVSDYRPTLPAGRGLVTRVGGSNDFTVTVSWAEREYNTDDVDSVADRESVTRSVVVRATLE